MWAVDRTENKQKHPATQGIGRVAPGPSSESLAYVDRIILLFLNGKLSKQNTPFGYGSKLYH